MRKPRIQFPGALYHAIVRGNQRHRTYLRPADYRQYLQIMGKKAISCSIKIYAYCLMPNHAHLLVEQAGYSPLSKFMQGLQTAYTKYFNKAHKKVGHVFQGRYKAILVERDNYLLELVRYIHLNPLRGKLEEKIGTYPWSSHRQYLGIKIQDAPEVAKEDILKMLGQKNGRKAYIQFIQEGAGDGHRDDLYKTSAWQILGSEGYEARSLARIGESPDRPLKLKLSIGEIWSRLKGKERFSEEPQGLARTRLVEKAAWLAVECAGASQTSVGSYFNLGQGAISAGLKRLALNFDKNPENRKRLLTWAKSLKD